MDVMRGFMNWPLQVKIEKTEGLASRAFSPPPLSAVAKLSFLALPCELG